MLWVAAALGLVLVGAWVDGGEEPLRTISEPVSVSAVSAPGGMQ